LLVAGAAAPKTLCLTRYVPRLPSEAPCCPRSLNRSLLPPKQAPTLRTARPLRLLPLPHEFGSSYHLPVKHWDNGPGILPPILQLLQAMHCRRRWKAKLCCRIDVRKSESSTQDMGRWVGQLTVQNDRCFP
jgi:hypothetical protein